MLACGGIKEWLKTGNIPTAVRLQIKIHCLQARTTGRVKELGNAGHDPRRSKNCLHNKGSIGMRLAFLGQTQLRCAMRTLQANAQEIRQELQRCMRTQKLSFTPKRSSTWANKKCELNLWKGACKNRVMSLRQAFCHSHPAQALSSHPTLPFAGQLRGLLFFHRVVVSASQSHSGVCKMHSTLAPPGSADTPPWQAQAPCL